MKTSELIQRVMGIGYRISFSATEKNIIYVDTYNGLHVASVNADELWWKYGEDVEGGEIDEELISIFLEYANSQIEEREVTKL